MDCVIETTSIVITILLVLTAFEIAKAAGSALSISMPLVLFSVILWTYLRGALGAFLRVPLAIAALTLFEEFPSTIWIADIFSGGRTAKV